jgi:F0F1-type ATP synthase delta subunit
MKEIDAARLYEIAGVKAVALEEELQVFAEQLLKNLKLRYFLAGSAPLKAKKEVLAELLPGASPLFKRLLDLLIREGLINKLPWLAEKYSAVISERIGACYVEVRHAHKLSEAEKIRIFSLIESLPAGRHGGCRVRFVLDRSVLGGVKLRWQDGRYFDATLAGDLSNLKEALLV